MPGDGLTHGPPATKNASLAGLVVSFRAPGLVGRTRGLVAFRPARRMGGGARPVLLGHVSGFSGVAGLDPLVSITLHLLAGLLTGLDLLVYILVHLLVGLHAGCRLLRSGLLLRRCRECDRASGNSNGREN